MPATAGILPALLTALLLVAGGNRAYALDIDRYPDLRGLIDEMVDDHGFAEDDLRAWFTAAEIRDEIIEAIARPKENLPWHEYRKIFLTDEHVRKGLAFWERHALDLAQAQEEYGVAPEIIVAILGVETVYGKNTGGFRVLDALTTLVLRWPARAGFFRAELVEYLLLTRELGVSPLSVKGSYAGAMGAPQFIASSYRRYAVDFDGDQRRDLLGNTADAIGSVANFLSQHGWQAGEPVCDAATVQGPLYRWIENAGPEPGIRSQYLKYYGITPGQERDALQLAALITLEGEDGPMFRLGYTNFYVITRYNRSKRYAMAVYELSRLIAKRYYGETP